MMTDLQNAPSLVGFGQLLSKNGAPSAPEKNELGWFVKSSITQPRIARFCWNLVGWYITRASSLNAENDWQGGGASSGNALLIDTFSSYINAVVHYEAQLLNPVVFF